MSNTPHTELQTKSRGLTLYVLAWMLLGGIAAGYLVALAVKPDLVAQYLPAFRPNAANQEVVGEVRALRESVSQVQMDVARLSVEVGEQDERDKEMTERIAVLETRPPLASAAVESAGGTATPGAPGAPTPAEAISAAMQTEPTGSPAVEPQLDPPSAAEPGKTLETGSVGKAPATFGPAVVKPAATPKGVEIGSAPTVDALRLSWMALSDRHGEALKNLQARYVMGRDDSGEVYKLIAGPVKNSAEAKRICGLLEGDGVACSVGSYNGNAL